MSDMKGVRGKVGYRDVPVSRGSERISAWVFEPYLKEIDHMFKINRTYAMRMFTYLMISKRGFLRIFITLNGYVGSQLPLPGQALV